MARLIDLAWGSRFTDSLPGDTDRRNFVRQVRNASYTEVAPTPVHQPSLIGWADRLAESLGIDRPNDDDIGSLEVLAGNRVAPGMRPFAARYGGHQFGQWAGQLGDGRAITLGEVIFPGVGPLEFQLKGPGTTPYSRRADGRAVLRSSLREFLCSEAMHFLGVPTTRALSLVTTGETVIRDMFYDGNPTAEPGAIVCRVAPTFIRFGNFEILAATGEIDLLKRLTDFTIRNYFPTLDPADPDVYGQLLDEVCRRTAEMIVHWQRVGFVHGVMNTDNMSILGLTIDYGPYGWLEPYDPNWTPNTTDAGMRRYRFGHQPTIAYWNLGRLATALSPLVPAEKRLQQSLELYREAFHTGFAAMIAQKLGISSLDSEVDQAMAESMFELMHEVETDYVLFFRGLSNWPAKSAPLESFWDHVRPAFYANTISEPLRRRWNDWAAQYVARLQHENRTDADRLAAMKCINPKYVPRNYLAQNAISAAEAGDLSVLERLMRVLEKPYDEQPAQEDLAARRPDWAKNRPGCSALSCSS